MQRLARELAAARPPLDAVQRRVAIALYRLLAEGSPVSVARLVERTGVTKRELARILDGPYGVALDEHGDVVGFWGLTLSATPHRLRIDGQALHAWCGWDSLFLPALIGASIEIASSCPATGAPIALTVTPERVAQVEPADAVLSLRHPDERFTADTRASFCCHVHFFASPDAFATRPARDEATFAVAVDDGFEIARLVNEATYAEALQ